MNLKTTPGPVELTLHVELPQVAVHLSANVIRKRRKARKEEEQKLRKEQLLDC